MKFRPEETLARQERNVARLVHAEMTNPEIAAALNIAEQVVKNYLRIIFDKVGVNTRVGLALWYEDRFKTPRPETDTCHFLRATYAGPVPEIH